MKNINLRVRRDGEIVVSANGSVRESRINEFVQSKSDWIGKRLEISQVRAEKSVLGAFKGGAVLTVLGKPYRLEIVESRYKRVIMYENEISIHIPDPSNLAAAEKQYVKWLAQLAEDVFTDTVGKLMPAFVKYDIPVPDIAIRDMRARWGTCNIKKKLIRLNLKLIKASPYCIEYVVLHELAHLKHPDHSREYHFFLSILMPDWKFRKKKLNEETDIVNW